MFIYVCWKTMKWGAGTQSVGPTHSPQHIEDVVVVVVHGTCRYSP